MLDIYEGVESVLHEHPPHAGTLPGAFLTTALWVGHYHSPPSQRREVRLIEEAVVLSRHQ